MWRKFLYLIMDFDIVSKKALLDLHSKVEDMEEIEAELTDDGVLSITAKNGEYVINKHFATKQIWYSSPVSSLKYFNFKKNRFVERNNPDLTLEDALFKDLRKI